MLSYSIITEFFRSHEESHPRPRIIEHLIATCTIGFVGGCMATNTLRGGFQGFLFGGLNLGLLAWWFQNHTFRPGGGQGPANIAYDKDVTPEERERIEMMDQVQQLAHNMSIQPGYGIVQIEQKYQ